MLHEITETDQQVNWAYYPLANGLYERQVETIKELLKSKNPKISLKNWLNNLMV